MEDKNTTHTETMHDCTRLNNSNKYSLQGADNSRTTQKVSRVMLKSNNVKWVKVHMPCMNRADQIRVQSKKNRFFTTIPKK